MRSRSRNTVTANLLLSILIVVVGACSGPSEPPVDSGASPGGAARAYDLAVERCRSGDDPGAIVALREALESDPALFQRALLEPAFHSGLRDGRECRELLREACIASAPRSLRLVSRDEPGEWITIEGRVVDEDGSAVPGAWVSVFATDAEGRYHPEIEGERVPRIFGMVVSDAEGTFALETVRPGPYPGTRNPRHIHVGVRQGDRRLASPGYAVFDDDPLLFEPGNEEPRGEAVRIAMQGSTGSLVLTIR